MKLGVCKTCHQVAWLTPWNECYRCQKARWEAMEREADECLARGETAGPFDTVEELFEYLKRESLT